MQVINIQNLNYFLYIRLTIFINRTYNWK